MIVLYEGGNFPKTNAGVQGGQEDDICFSIAIW